MEAAGSRDCARKIRDLKRPCDVLASADYLVIEQLLVPDYADWNICFAAVPEQLEKAALTLGASPARVLFTISI